MLQPIIDVIKDVLTGIHGPNPFGVWTGNWALAIVLLTLVIKLILHPLTRKQVGSMKAMQVLKPKMDEVRRKFKDDPQRMNQETMALYRAHNVNPLSGCLPLLVQFPVLIALYQALLQMKEQFERSREILLGVGLAETPKLAVEYLTAHPLVALIPIAVGLSTYLQQRMTMTDPSQARLFVFMPFMIAFFSFQVPVGLSVYWFASTVFTIFEYLSILGLPGRYPPAPAPAPVVATPPDEEAPRQARRKVRRV